MINIREEILQELLEVSPAIAKPIRNNVYSVPLNYFDSLAGNIMTFVKNNIAGHSFIQPIEVPFGIPENYFSELPTQILAAIHKDTQMSEVEIELQEIAPLLNTINKEMVYTVPDQYFSLLIVTVSTIEKITKLRVVKSTKHAFKYAMAAAVTGIIAVSTYLIAPQISKVLNPSENTSSINIAAKIKTVPDTDIIDYLDKNTFGPEVLSLQSLTDEDMDVKNIIQNVSDQDIREYLNANEEQATVKAKDT
jgi:hypothetical protein